MSTNRIILKEFPGVDVGPVLVTYRDGDSLGLSIADGYFSAAERLVNSLDQEGITASEDILAFPILFLVRHALELSLKAYMAALINHRSYKCCENILYVNESKMGGHELVPLFDSVRDAIKEDELHSDINGFLNFEGLIRYLDESDLSSESMRYTKNSNGKTTLFFQEQRYVVLRELLGQTRAFIHFINGEVENSSMEDCRIGLFRKQAKLDYERAIRIVEDSQPIRDEFQRGYKHPKQDKTFVSISEMGQSFADNFAVNELFKSKAKDLFASTSPEERAQLAYSLELCKGKDSGTRYFLDYGEEFYERYISDNILKLSNVASVDGLRRRAEYMLEKRSLWKPSVR